MNKCHLLAMSGVAACMLGVSVPNGAQAQSITADTNINASADTNADLQRNRNAPRAATGRLNWDAEDRYWRDTYRSRPYYERGEDYGTYRPAYEYGADLYDRYEGRNYSTLDQNEMRQGWENRYGSTTGMDWDEARGPVSDSYNRLYNNRANRMGSQSYGPPF